MVDYYKRLVEVDEVLNYLPFEELQKIPEELRKIIKDNKDTNYIWKYDETKSLGEQGLSRETIAILAYINMEYIATKEQRELLQQYYKANSLKLEKRKSESYKENNIFENKETVEKQLNVVNTDLIEKKENIFLKFWNKIKSYFKK